MQNTHLPPSGPEGLSPCRDRSVHRPNLSSWPVPPCQFIKREDQDSSNGRKSFRSARALVLARLLTFAIRGFARGVTKVGGSNRPHQRSEAGPISTPMPVQFPRTT